MESLFKTIFWSKPNMKVFAMKSKGITPIQSKEEISEDEISLNSN